MKKSLLMVAVLGLALVAVIAHPHIQKSVSAKLGDVEAKLSFYTAPANEEHVKNAKLGDFSASPARLTLSGDLKVGDLTIAAGEYTMGAIKNSESDWTMALYPGQLGRREAPDMSKVIKLESWFSNSQGTAGHIYYDIIPGVGSFEGRATLVWHFGTLYLAGALTNL